MIITINDNIKIWQEFNPFEGPYDKNAPDSFSSTRTLANWGFNKERISIKNRWFDVLSLGELVRKRNAVDGYYRAVYIQINMENGEYYIGKVNRPKWSELKRYQGSGLRFVNKYRKNKEQFVRYYIAICETAYETEQLEASIVDKGLLVDEKCLNLVAGGGGISKRPSIAETREKKREYMKSHPEQFKPMLEASKKAFQSGNSTALHARNIRIKEVMSVEKHRQMTADRLKKWREENPLKYAEARRKNHEAIKSSESQEKRIASLKKWAEKNPDKHAIWQEKLLRARTSKDANEKHKVSLKGWRDNNLDQANANAHKRAKAAAAKRSKQVCMMDLNSGEVLRNFISLHEFAKWLV